MPPLLRSLSLALLAALTAAPPLAAQQTRRPSHCIAVADATPGIEVLHKAAWSNPVPDYSVRIHYITHASFLLQTPGGLNAITDFTGFTGPAEFVPDIVTMNHAHSSHWTATPDPRIPNVLPGWGPFGEGIEHYLDLGEMLVRNVSTDIRSAYGGSEEKGNSIFVFEVEGLCIGHLGHLHQEPSEQQYAALGRVDVLMVPVDGGMTMPIDAMVRVVERLRSSIILPMHWFSGNALERFLREVSDRFAVERRSGPEMTVSLRDLPSRPTIVVLQPAWLRD